MNIDEWLGNRLLLTRGAKTAAAPAASPIFEPSVKIRVKPSYSDSSDIFVLRIIFVLVLIHSWSS